MRKIILGTTQRCPRCRLTPRWCVCAGERAVTTPLAIDVITHVRENFRPSSTGALIARVCTGARSHVWRDDAAVAREAVGREGRELWILHPSGEPMPADARPEAVQVVLLDGAWSEASKIAQRIAGWGRRVSLPMTGESRYWLRAQQDGARYSTAEALLFLLEVFGFAEARAALRVQFELHVYAGLRARGRKDLAEKFLEDSPLRTAMPELIAAMNVVRPKT